MAKTELNVKLVEDLKAAATVDGSKVTIGDKATFYAAAETHAQLPAATIDAVDDFKGQYNAAALKAGWEIGKGIIAGDKTVTSIEVTAPIGNNGTTDYNIEATKLVSVPPREKGGDATKKLSFGIVGAKFETRETNPNAGLLAAVKTGLKQEASELFAVE